MYIFHRFLFLGTIFWAGGCGSVISHSSTVFDSGVDLKKNPPFFSGVKMDYQVYNDWGQKEKGFNEYDVLPWIDMPLSLALDVVLIPIDTIFFLTATEKSKKE